MRARSAAKEKPRRGDRAALVFAQRLDRKPSVPQTGGCHCDRRLGQGLGGSEMVFFNRKGIFQ
jgi:hypothetical protein